MDHDCRQSDDGLHYAGHPDLGMCWTEDQVRQAFVFGIKWAGGLDRDADFVEKGWNAFKREGQLPIRFADLALGERFRFYAGGSLLTKTGERRYAAPQWGQHDLIAHDPEQTVLRE